MKSDRDAYDELCFYTLSHGGTDFIHQHVVDAFGAQNASENDKPIKLVFALIGLYLHIEKQLTGKQVQQAHMKLGRLKPRAWPTFSMPSERGSITAAHVLKRPPGPERDLMIHQWCASVWEAFAENRLTIVDLLNEVEIR